MGFLHTYQPSSVLFKIGFWQIHWYGLLIVIAILLGIWLTIFLAKKKIDPVKSRQAGVAKPLFNRINIINLVFYLLIFGLLGARLFYVLLFPNYFFSHPLEILKIWQGGLGIFGAVFTGLLVIFFYARRHNLSYLCLLDLFAPALILGQAIGRWGNYFNQELYGLPTNLPWGIPIGNLYVHPCFLYESFWDLGVFLILLFLYKKKIPGLVFSFYLILYPLGRFFIEFLRVDFQPIILNLRLFQFVSLILIGTGLLLFFRCRARAKAQIL